VKTPVGWKVPSQSGNGTYIVNLDHGNPFCTCPDFEKGNICKHIHAVEFVVQRETLPDGTTIETKSVKMTCTQEWTAYNDAQTHEQERFPELLSELCKGIVQPKQEGAGRRNHLLSDIIMAATCKVYSTMSGRRAMTDLRELQAKGFVTNTPSYNSIFDYLENPALTPLLKSLIEESASPLKTIEHDFAVDSSGFATTTYNRWFDHKWGKVRSEAKWIKAHLMCGVATHVVTSVEVTPTETADAPQLPQLVNVTAKTFAVNEVSADKAYSSRKNLRAVSSVGGVAYIPFKNRTTGCGGHGDGFDGLWNYMWAYYNYNRAEFLNHYHKRSNVESVFSMIKTKFGWLGTFQVACGSGQ